MCRRLEWRKQRRRSDGWRGACERRFFCPFAPCYSADLTQKNGGKGGKRESEHFGQTRKKMTLSIGGGRERGGPSFSSSCKNMLKEGRKGLCSRRIRTKGAFLRHYHAWRHGFGDGAKAPFNFLSGAGIFGDVDGDDDLAATAAAAAATTAATTTAAVATAAAAAAAASTRKSPHYRPPRPLGLCALPLIRTLNVGRPQRCQVASSLLVGESVGGGIPRRICPIDR